MQKTTKTHRQKCLEAAAEVRAKRHPGILDFDALKDLTTANVVVALLGVLEKQGMEIYVASPDETTRLIRESVAEYGKVIRDAKITFRP